MTNTKKPGLLSDPWRRQPAPPTPAAIPKKQPPPKPEEEKYHRHYVTLVVDNYGGITLENGNSVSDVALELLDLCIKHMSLVDPILTEYGVVVVNLPTEPAHLSFFLRREDGWTLAVPDAPTRTVAGAQLIQAVLAMQTVPELKALLTKYKLRAYKV